MLALSSGSPGLGAGSEGTFRQSGDRPATLGGYEVWGLLPTPAPNLPCLWVTDPASYFYSGSTDFKRMAVLLGLLDSSWFERKVLVSPMSGTL